MAPLALALGLGLLLLVAGYALIGPERLQELADQWFPIDEGGPECE